MGVNSLKKEKFFRRRKKLIRRFLHVFIPLQIMILFFFAILAYSSAPIEKEDCAFAKVTVEEKTYKRNFSEMIVQITSNGVKYNIANSGRLNEYTAKEMYDEIAEYDVLDIIYVKRYGFFRTYNLAVDVRDTNTTYLDFEYYNSQKEKAFTAVIVFFAIIEAFVLMIIALTVILNKRRLFYPNSTRL